MQTTKAATHKGRSRVCWFTREVAGPSGFDRQPVTGPTKLQSTIKRALPCVGVPNSMYSTWEACNSPCWPRSDPTHPRTSPPPITHTHALTCLTTAFTVLPEAAAAAAPALILPVADLRLGVEGRDTLPPGAGVEERATDTLPVADFAAAAAAPAWTLPVAEREGAAAAPA